MTVRSMAEKPDITSLEEDEELREVNSDSLKQIKQEVKRVIESCYDDLAESLCCCLRNFANKMHSAQLITVPVMKSGEFNAIMQEYKAGMSSIHSCENLVKYCSKLLDILQSLGGPAKRTADDLHDKWNTSIQERFGIPCFIRPRIKSLPYVPSYMPPQAKRHAASDSNLNSFHSNTTTNSSDETQNNIRSPQELTLPRPIPSLSEGLVPGVGNRKPPTTYDNTEQDSGMPATSKEEEFIQFTSPPTSTEEGGNYPSDVTSHPDPDRKTDNDIDTPSGYQCISIEETGLGGNLRVDQEQDTECHGMGFSNDQQESHTSHQESNANSSHVIDLTPPSDSTNTSETEKSRPTINIRSTPGSRQRPENIGPTHSQNHTRQRRSIPSVSPQQGSNGLNISGHYHYAKEKTCVQNAHNTSYYNKLIDFSHKTVNYIRCATEPVPFLYNIIVVLLCLLCICVFTICLSLLLLLIIFCIFVYTH